MSYLAFVGGDDDDKPKPSRHSAMALVATALATSVDATAVGITLGFMDVHIPLTIALIGAVTFAIAFGGVLIGRAAGPLLNRWAEFAGGIGGRDQREGAGGAWGVWVGAGELVASHLSS